MLNGLGHSGGFSAIQDKIAQQRDAMFAKLDQDDNGGLSAAEISGTRVESVITDFTTVDADSDGMLSKDELVAAREAGKLSLPGSGMGATGLQGGGIDAAVRFQDLLSSMSSGEDDETDNAKEPTSGLADFLDQRDTLSDRFTSLLAGIRPTALE